MAAKHEKKLILHIGRVAQMTGFSPDTLRYYEKLGLLKPQRDTGGIRVYSSKELSALNFIRRAKAMNFSLEDIALLLEMRHDPQNAKNHVRRLTQNKLEQLEHQLQEMNALRNELTLLLNLCSSANGVCPIIDGLEGNI